jgi:hypothetical protein
MTQDEIIEMARQAGMEQDGDMWFSNLYKTDMDVHISHLETFAKLVAAKAIAELESQELKQTTVKDFVHMVEGKEDLIGRPVYFAQWPNSNTHPPQRTWVGLTDERRKQLINKCWNEYIAGKEDASSFSEWISVAIEAELKEKNT